MADLAENDAPESLKQKARNKEFHDFESPYALPKMRLVRHLSKAGLSEMAEKAKKGRYDDKP